MATTVVAATTSSSSIHLYGLSSKKTSKITSVKRGGSRRRGSSNLGHLTEIVRKDMEIMKNGIGKGLEWANEAFRIPKILKTVDDFIWLRNLEDPCAARLPPSSWRQRSYPGLSTVDLLMADLKALEAYAYYFYYLSTLWSKPLPEVYDPQDVADYVSRRPHLVAFRLIENGHSLILALVSKEARFFRQQLCRNIGEILSKWFLEALGHGQDFTTTQYKFQVRSRNVSKKRDTTSLNLGVSIYDSRSILKDRRLKMIFSKV